MIDFSWSRYPTPVDLPAVTVDDPLLPLISIVTPSYNQGKFIRETIESVLSQDYPNIEYWVIDGGSRDETLDILHEYERDPRFHWMSESDKGQSDAINKGWSRCRGDILAWLCSDDLYCPNILKDRVAFLMSHNEIDAIYGDSGYIDEHGQDLWIFRSRKFSQYELLRTNFISQPTTFMRHDLIRRTGTVDISLNFAMDYDFWIRASCHGNFAYFPGIIAKCRLHRTSKTVSQGQRFFSENKKAIESFFEQPNIPEDLRCRQHIIYADQQLSNATITAQSGQFSGSLKYVWQSIHYSLFRPRLLSWILAVIEGKTKIHLYQWLAENWLKLRSKL